MKLLKWLDEHFEAYTLVFLSVLTVAIIFIQVVMRYVFSNSLTWTEELARYAFIWLIYIGVSYGVKKKKHLRVDAFSMLFKRKGQIVISMIANLSFLVFVVVMTFFGMEVVTKVARESAALQIPLTWVYLAPVVGFILTTIRLIQNLNCEIKELKSINRNKNSYVKRSEEGAV